MREVVLEARGLQRGSWAPALQRVLSRVAGVHDVEANAFSDSVTVHYDPDVTTQTALEQLIEQCGYHCRGEMVPAHICEPAEVISAEQRTPRREHAARKPAVPDHAAHEHAAHELSGHLAPSVTASPLTRFSARSPACSCCTR